MQQEQRENMPDGACNGFEERWALFTAGELDASEVAEMKSHLVECEPCNQTLAQEDALDREEEHGWLRRAVGAVLPVNWISPAPAWSAAVLLLIGFSVGVLGPRFWWHPAVTGNSQAA